MIATVLSLSLLLLFDILLLLFHQNIHRKLGRICHISDFLMEKSAASPYLKKNRFMLQNIDILQLQAFSSCYMILHNQDTDFISDRCKYAHVSCGVCVQNPVRLTGSVEQMAKVHTRSKAGVWRGSSLLHYSGNDSSTLGAPGKASLLRYTAIFIYTYFKIKGKSM